jgi:hypothetical protein
MTSQIFRYGTLAVVFTLSGATFAQSSNQPSDTNPPPGAQAPGDQPGMTGSPDSQSSSAAPMHHRRHHHHRHHHMGHHSVGAGGAGAAGGAGSEPGDTGK